MGEGWTGGASDIVKAKSSGEDPRATGGLVSNLPHPRVNKTKQHTGVHREARERRDAKRPRPVPCGLVNMSRVVASHICRLHTQNDNSLHSIYKPEPQDLTPVESHCTCHCTDNHLARRSKHGMQIHGKIAVKRLAVYWWMQSAGHLWQRYDSLSHVYTYMNIYTCRSEQVAEGLYHQNLAL